MFSSSALSIFGMRLILPLCAYPLLRDVRAIKTRGIGLRDDVSSVLLCQTRFMNQPAQELKLMIGRATHELMMGRATNLEMRFRNAVLAAETAYGPESGEVGVCLIELADYLEKVEKFEEAEQVTERYRALLLSLARKHGLI